VADRWQYDAGMQHDGAVKMAAPLQHAPKKNSVLSSIFLSAEGVKHIEIHRRMKVQYSDACLSIQQVYEWNRKFTNGVSSVTDSPRPGQAHRVVTPEGIAAVEAIVKENRRVTVKKNRRASGCESWISTAYRP